MVEKCNILFVLKKRGRDISGYLEQMYKRYGKEEFQTAARNSGNGYIIPKEDRVIKFYS